MDVCLPPCRHCRTGLSKAWRLHSKQKCSTEYKKINERNQARVTANPPIATVGVGAGVDVDVGAGVGQGVGVGRACVRACGGMEGATADQAFLGVLRTVQRVPILRGKYSSDIV